MSPLQPGIPAPEFTLADHTGTLRSLSEFKGSYIVLYFYPKDDTLGCTKEACMIRDSYNDFEANGIVVLGVSKDSPESHVKFREKYELPFILLSDMDKSVINAYGADGLLFNKRITYVIYPNGIIAKIYPNVDPASHAMELLQDIKNLSK
jgi:peroxiredoxin Q/BCP